MQKGNKKVLLVLGVVLILLLLSVVGVFTYEYIRIKPNDVRFSNITSSSVTVSWNTEKKSSASVKVYDGDRLLPISFFDRGDRFFDTRDVKAAELKAAENTSKQLLESNDPVVTSNTLDYEIEVTDRGEYYTHHVTVIGLEPETEYSFMIGDSYLFREVGDSEENTTVNTLPIPNEIKSPVPAYGAVKNAEGKEDLPIEDLVSVTDGIIYFNYLDEFSNERSSVYSSSFNEEGNWYMDISNAVGEDGENFLDRFDTDITNILVELVVDTGPLGRWEKLISFNEFAPTPMIVINDPLSASDVELGIKRVDSMNSVLVKGANAQTCRFAGYCGPCYGSSFADTCSCPESTLKARGCKGESTKSMDQARQEAASQNASKTCAGGAAVGQYVHFQGACRKCNSTLKWSVVGDNYCTGHTDGRIFNYEEPEEEEEEEVEEPAAKYTCYKVKDNSCVKYESTDSECPGGFSGYVDCLNVQDPCRGKESGDFCVKLDGSTGMCSTTGLCRTSIAAPCQGGASSEGINCIVNGVMGTCNDSYTCVPKDVTVGSSNENSDVVNCRPNLTFMKKCLTLSGEVGRCNRAGGCFKEGADCLIDGEENRSGGYNSVGNCVASFIGTTIEQVLPFRIGGQLCNHSYPCLCKSTDRFLPGLILGNTWCPQIRDEDSCDANTEGWLCKVSQDRYICHQGDCVPAGSVEGVQDEAYNHSDFNQKLTFEASAAEENTEYIFDSETGIISSIQEGTYLFEYEDEQYAFIVPEGKDEIMVYIDENDNAKYDEGIDTLLTDLAAMVKVIPIKKTYKYQLKAGLNFVSLPFIIPEDGLQTAAALLKEINELYPDSVLSISKFNGRWKIVGQNVEVYDNEDFQLLPGEGYMIKAKRDIEISIIGQPVKFEAESDSAPITFSTGWNLIGLYGTKVKSYTARTLIQNINEDDFTADNVTKWAKDKQMYEGFQLEGTEEYGFDYPLNKLESYFVRITQGKGNWQPELSGNN